MLIAISINEWAVFVSVAAIVVGVLSFWLSKLLSDKKDITIIQVNMEHMERRLKKAEEEIEELQDYYNRGRNN